MKIFGIGMPKTATTSLAGALKVLGYSAYHYPVRLLRHVRRSGDIVLPPDWDAIVQGYDYFYPQLDERYPDSKFILTIRDRVSWLRSCERFFSIPHIAQALTAPDTVHATGMLTLFGINAFNRRRFIYVYEKHYRDVTEYFAGRKQKLLITNLGEDGWSKLCPFLGKPVPDAPFPYMYRTDEVIAEAEAAESSSGGE
jgi:hypothetical protein